MQGPVSFAFLLAIAGTVIAAPSNVDPNFVRSSENALLNAGDLNAAMEGPFRSTASKLAQRLVVPDSANCLGRDHDCDPDGRELCCRGLICAPFGPFVR